MKIQKNKIGRGQSGPGGCERRIEVFVKIKKEKNIGWGGRSGRMGSGRIE